MKLTKLIITIPEDKYKYIQELDQGTTDYATTRMLYHAVKNGIPFDKVRAEITMYESNCRLAGGSDECEQCNTNVFDSIYRIIDKYKGDTK